MLVAFYYPFKLPIPIESNILRLIVLCLCNVYVETWFLPRLYDITFLFCTEFFLVFISYKLCCVESPVEAKWMMTIRMYIHFCHVYTWCIRSIFGRNESREYSRTRTILITPGRGGGGSTERSKTERGREGPGLALWARAIEEGRAASESHHKTLDIFFLFPSKEFLPISFKILLL